MTRLLYKLAGPAARASLLVGRASLLIGNHWGGEQEAGEQGQQAGSWHPGEWPGLRNGQDWRMARTEEWPVQGLGGKIGPYLASWWKKGGYSGIEMK